MLHCKGDEARDELDHSIGLFDALLDPEWVDYSLSKSLAELSLPRQLDRLAVGAERGHSGAAQEERMERVDVLAVGGYRVLRGRKQGRECLQWYSERVHGVRLIGCCCSLTSTSWHLVEGWVIPNEKAGEM